MSSRKIGGLWIICDDLDIANSLERGRKTASLNISKTSLSGNSSILSLISTDTNEINFLAVATASKISGDLERKVTFGPAIQFPEPISVEDIFNRLPHKYRNHVNQPSRRVVGIPPASWDTLLELVILLGGIDTKRVDHLKKVILSRESMKLIPMHHVVKYEHDAVAVALEAFQGSAIRQQYLSNSPVNSSAPFIQALEKSGANVLEDRMIDNDLSSFPGVQEMRRSLVGAVEIVTENGRLTLLNSNRTSVEKTLGVDLVYYHHEYKSFTFVQYKRLTGDQEPIYRPDSDASYAKEIDRMRQFLGSNPDQTDNDPLNYRIDGSPFFFKFCNSRPKDHWSRMTPGMYIPLGLWESFINSNEARGSRGGLFIGYNNAGRWLNNSEFVLLVRSGWIGSKGDMTKNLNSIIAQELSANKSIIYAAHRANDSGDEYLRDGQGRFASPEDVDAV